MKAHLCTFFFFVGVAFGFQNQATTTTTNYVQTRHDDIHHNFNEANTLTDFLSVKKQQHQSSSRLFAATLNNNNNDESDNLTTTAQQPPRRVGFAQMILNFALETPIWKHVLVPQARSNIVKTAEANGIPWKQSKEYIKSNMINEAKDGDDDDDDENSYKTFDTSHVPDYYKKAFHAYENGNLSWDSAFEVEIASCAVGARNFPKYGPDGEAAFRGAFLNALKTEAGCTVPNNAVILDLGCGTGMSTRALATAFPHVAKIHGVDLSPYFITVGKKLLELGPKSFTKGGNWVSSINKDAANLIEYQIGDAASVPFEPNTFDVVNLQFVLHELPPEPTRDIIQEAFRILKPGGQLWICEMDFQSPAYAAQRANALLFALIRSTEPYLDDYAESIPDMLDYVNSLFAATKVVPATGRHYALVATKGDSNEPSGGGIMEDLRFDENGSYRVEDTHLQVWESSRGGE